MAHFSTGYPSSEAACYAAVKLVGVPDLSFSITHSLAVSLYSGDGCVIKSTSSEHIQLQRLAVNILILNLFFMMVIWTERNYTEGGTNVLVLPSI